MKSINILDQPIYSRVDIAAAAQAQVQFFNTNIGQRQYTNLTTPRRLPGSNNFVCRGIGVYTHPIHAGAATQVTDDDITGFQLGHAEFKLDGSAQQLDTLVMDLPGGRGVAGMLQDGAAAQQLLLNGAPVYGSRKRFTVPIPIRKQQDFEFNVNFGSLNWTPTGVFAAIVFLDGRYTRRAL